MPIEVTCQSCSGQFRLPDSAAGKKIRCPKCKRPIEVPSGATPVFVMPMEEAGPPPSKPIVPLPPMPLPEAPPPAPKQLAADQPADEWQLKTADGEEYGPVPRSELDEWFREGRVTSECQILEGGTAQWRPAAELFPQLNGAGPSAAAAAETTAIPEMPVEPPSVPFEQPLPRFKGAPAKAASKSREPAPTAGALAAEDRSQRSRLVAGFLGVFLGPLGIHRFYLGYWGMGLAMLFTGGGLLLWSLIDAIFVMVGRVPDADGRPLSD